MPEEYKKQWTATVDSSTVSNPPKLSIDDQIEHLANKHGVTFNIKGKDAAKEFLQNNNFYHKIKAYSKNFSTYQSKEHPLFGKFCDLDFEYLVELSTIDMYLRRIIMTMSLDIEHFLKVKLINDITNNKNENAYNIVHKYLEIISDKKIDEISYKLNNYYSNTYNKHDLNNTPAWELVEVLSFGDFIEFYELYYKSYNPEDNMINNLKPVQWLRNAAAHNNCIINDLTVPEIPVFKVNKTINTFVSQIDGISPATRIKKLSNKSIHDFVVTLYVFNNVISSPKIKDHTMRDLKWLVNIRMISKKDYFEKNALINSSYTFFKKIVDYFTTNY